MRRVAVLIASCCMAMGVLGGLAVAAGAQTCDVAAFCAARIEANDARGKVASLSVTPGKCVYAWFLPQNGNEKNGEMHAKLGMYGSFTVS